MKQDEIINKITDEIFEEIENSGQSFTEEEIKKMINDRLDKLFEQVGKDSETPNKDATFTRDEIDDDMDDELEFSKDNDGLLNSLSSFQDTTDTQQQVDEQVEEQTEQPKEKKKFFQEISQLYREELKNSLDCFKSAIEALKLVKRTSVIETVIILLFLVVPAIFGGLFTLAFILILFLLWQLHIILKACYRYLDGAKKSIKETIATIRKKITSLKSGGGLFNRLIFSNALYSLIMFNGILYMFINGMVLPLRSAMEIDKILANLASKGVRALANGLRSPSELVTSRLGANAMKSGKTSVKEKGGLARNRLQLKSLSMSRDNLLKANKNLSGNLRAAGVFAVKNKIAKNILANIHAAQKNLVEQKANALTQKTNAINAVPNIQNIQIANSKLKKLDRSKLASLVSDTVSQRDKEGRGGGIGFNIPSALMRHFVAHHNKGGDDRGDNIGSSDGRSDRKKIEELVTQDLEAGKKGQNYSQDNIESALGTRPTENNMKSVDKIYKDTGDLSQALYNLPGFDKANSDEKLKAAFAFGQNRDAQDDIKDNYKLQKYVQDNPNATEKDVAEYDEKLARKDLQNEIDQFERRYGVAPNVLVAQKMEEKGIDPGTTLHTQDFIEITKEIVKEQKGLSEKDQWNMMKDFGEYGAAFIEKERTKGVTQKLEREQTHVNNINRSHGSGRGL